MTELSFLLELLLNHKLPKATRDALAARIKEVEASFAKPQIIPPAPAIHAPVQRPAKTAQSPSTEKLLAEKFTPEEREKMAGGKAIEPVPVPQPPEVPSQPVTPAAAQALQARQAAIMKAVSAGPFGAKPDDGRTSPRKW